MDGWPGYTLAPARQGTTRIRRLARGQLHGPFRLLQPLVQFIARRERQRTVDGLKASLESVRSDQRAWRPDASGQRPDVTMAFRLSDAVRIDQPPAGVWEQVAQLDRERRWRRPYVVDLAAEGDPLMPGTRVAGTTRAFGRTETYRNEVTEVIPARRLAWRGLDASGSLMGRSGSYELKPRDTGTECRLTITYVPQGRRGRVQAPLLGFVLRRVLRRFLRQLKDAAEGA